jgi:hypothetical protein
MPGSIFGESGCLNGRRDDGLPEAILRFEGVVESCGPELGPLDGAVMKSEAR